MNMTKFKSYLVTLVLANIIALGAFAQSTTISGIVKNIATGEKAPAISVTIKGSEKGTFTNDKGAYSITTKTFPVTLVFSSVGYTTQEVTFASAADVSDVSLVPNNGLGQEVVVSATRVSQKILESPVSIERVSNAAIRQAPAANFYDIVLGLKGVDVTTSSLTFKTPTTRGFNSSGNARFNQLIDGMDNQAPGLNFSVGSIVGISELDVDNMELLSGASSALYGPGGMNGTLLINSKNPFKYQGASFLVKTGVMHTDRNQRDASAFHNWNVRYAKKIGNNFAFKVNMELIQAKDWLGVDQRNYKRTGTQGTVVAGNRQTDPNYDGINTYGDETTGDISAAFASIAGGVPGAASFMAANADFTNLSTGARRRMDVSRTGYTEKELLNPNTTNYKLTGSLHYKLTDKTELVGAAYFGTGNTIYTGSDRYSLKDFKIAQYKIELMNKNWYLRGYTTQENSGQSYNATATARLFNETWKPSATAWFPQYAFKYLSDRMSGIDSTQAHLNARALADVGRPKAGTPALTNAFDAIRKTPISKGGGQLLDKSDLYVVEGNYNLSSWTKGFADILVGADYKQYVLNSEGTLFADSVGATIGISEYGGYIQAIKEITSALKITASGRYDKNQNFKGKFTPRVTATYKVKENNNIRLSFQTAYRFPTTQQQWIDLQVGSTRLVGGTPFFATKYNYAGNPLFATSADANGNVIVAPTSFTPGALKPEALSSFEIGYKGLMNENKLLVDAYFYYGQYQDFLARQNARQFVGGVRDISVPINATDKVKTNGFGVSFDYRLPKNFTVGANLSSDVLTNVPANFVAYFNAPKYKTNMSVGNSAFGYQKRFGASATYRWQQGYYYQGDFANGNLPDVHNVDAQISFKMPATKSVIKLGANNILNQYYYNAIGNSQVGGLYYVSFGYNIY
jgi:outer membrane receptor protein involved in Fe transport